MKRIKFAFCLFSVALATIAQTSTENYILSRTYTSGGTGTSATFLDQIQYFDGLGRPIQTVQKGITPGTYHYDLATYTEYDNAGRVSKQWLPILGSAGSFVNQSFFSNGSALYANDSHAYTETHYEASPLNRADWQQGPGSAWQNHRTLTTYDTNASYEVKCFTVSGTSLINNSYYASASLYKTTVTDEDGNPTTEYKDKLGRVVMKRGFTEEAGNHDTYYVYNDLGQLCFVLPPLAADASGSADAINKYGYVYHYDERGNCKYKKLPGCEPINMTYYPNDLLETSQDGNQLAKNEKLRYVYDGLNRLVTTSLESNSTSTSTLLNENYYDNYNFIGSQSNLVFVPMSGYDGQYSSAKGLLTGTRTRILDNTNTYIYSAIYYDYRGLPVQTRSTNHLGGYDFVYNAYDFTGHVTKNLKVHNIPAKASIMGQAAITELYDYVYDHAGRLMTTTYQVNDKAAVVLVSNTYDNLGRLVAKQRHGGAESEEFRYNLRNWLTMHNYGCGFMEALGYNTPPETGIYFIPCYNGNISSQTFGQLCTAQKDYYIFYYNDLNRLTRATGMYRNNTTFTYSGHDEYYSYDKMGNITRLYRNRNHYSSIDDLIYTYNGNQINAIYDYYGSINSYSVKEYQDKNHEYYAPTEMVYDANGNLIKDLDRDIVTIKYNILNLPELIQFKNGNQIINKYDANGLKLSSRNYTVYDYTLQPIVAENTIRDVLLSDEVYVNGTDYIGNVEYEYNADYYYGQFSSEYSYIKRLNNPEGYCDELPYLIFNYYRRDHLGNVREVWRAPNSAPGYCFPSTTIQRTQYYSSGLPWESNSGDNPGLQNKKYNGKEFIEMHGFDTYDYGARGYYPAIGRFMTVDPLCEKYYGISPYAYCAGNPANRIDPDGRDWVDRKGKIIWIDNVKSANDKDLQKGDKYLGRNVLVGTHKRDANLKEPINGARFDLYLEGNHKGTSATIFGNTVPADTKKSGTLAEGLYKAVSGHRNKPQYQNELALRIYNINGTDGLPTVNGNPNPKSDGQTLTGVLFHIGNQYQESLKDSKGHPFTEGCQTSHNGSDAIELHNAFFENIGINFDGYYYLRGQ